MRLRIPYLKNSLLILLALQILNLSIYNTSFYATDDLAGSTAQVRDENPIDSFAEFIVEDVGGIPNAFPEETDAGKSSKQSGELKHNITFKMVHEDRFEKIEIKPVLTPEERSTFPLFCDNYAYMFWKEINHPPS